MTNQNPSPTTPTDSQAVTTSVHVGPNLRGRVFKGVAALGVTALLGGGIAAYEAFTSHDSAKVQLQTTNRHAEVAPETTVTSQSASQETTATVVAEETPNQTVDSTPPETQPQFTVQLGEAVDDIVNPDMQDGPADAPAGPTVTTTLPKTG